MKLLTIISLLFICTTIINSSQASQPVVRWTTKEDAGLFIDPEPNTKYIQYLNQFCVKEKVVHDLNDKQKNVIKVRCRMPNGKFSYIW